MKKTGIFYGSTTGATEQIAKTIAEKLGVSSDDVMEVSKMKAENLNDYDFLILGSSTWGSGELQDDWYSAIDVLKKADLSGKKIAIFGTGDSYSYSDTFCDAIGQIYDAVKDSGATVVGFVDPAEYDFDSSVSVVDGHFVGLALDEDNESDKTEARIDNWINTLNV